jgi:hypothetical protein
MILLGAIQRPELLRMLDDQLSMQSKVAFFEKRNTRLLPIDEATNDDVSPAKVVCQPFSICIQDVSTEATDEGSVKCQ